MIKRSNYGIAGILNLLIITYIHVHDIAHWTILVHGNGDVENSLKKHKHPIIPALTESDFHMHTC